MSCSYMAACHRLMNQKRRKETCLNWLFHGLKQKKELASFRQQLWHRFLKTTNMSLFTRLWTGEPSGPYCGGHRCFHRGLALAGQSAAGRPTCVWRLIGVAAMGCHCRSLLYWVCTFLFIAFCQLLKSISLEFYSWAQTHTSSFLFSSGLAAVKRSWVAGEWCQARRTWTHWEGPTWTGLYYMETMIQTKTTTIWHWWDSAAQSVWEVRECFHKNTPTEIISLFWLVYFSSCPVNDLSEVNFRWAFTLTSLSSVFLFTRFVLHTLNGLNKPTLKQFVCGENVIQPRSRQTAGRPVHFWNKPAAVFSCEVRHVCRLFPLFLFTSESFVGIFPLSNSDQSKE